MPNWCSNSLVIRGKDASKIFKKISKKKSKKESLLDKKDDSKGIFETLIGVNSSEFDHKKNWYDHNIATYGTKWDVSYDEIVVDNNDDELSMSFETAWSPPVTFFVTLCERYDIDYASLTYEESGMDFSGVSEYDKINGVSNTEYSSYMEGKYLNNKEVFWEELELYQIEYFIENDINLDDALKEYPFLEKSDIKTFTDMYNEALNASKE